MDKVKTIVNFTTTVSFNATEIIINVASADENPVLDFEQRNIDKDTLEIWTGQNGTGTKLTESIDYELTRVNLGASSATTKEIYNGISITNETYQEVSLYIPELTLGLYGDVLDESDINRLQDQLGAIIGDDIVTSDILIPVNGVIDSQGNEAVEKSVSWNPYETWKSTGVDGDLRFARGEAGVFAEYENIWNDSSYNLGNSLEVEAIGDWQKFENGDALLGSVKLYLTTTTEKVSGSFFVKAGSSTGVQLNLSVNETLNVLQFFIASNIFTLVSGSFDSYTSTEIVEGEIYKIEFTLDAGAYSGTPYFTIYPTFGTVSGDYTYFKDIQIVEGIDYPVPYVQGTHLADSWVHPVNWSESDEWTIDTVLRTSGVPSEDYIFFAGDDNFNYFSVRYSDGSTLKISSNNDSTATVESIAVSGLDAQEYHDIKAVLISETSIALYVDSVLVHTKTTVVPSVSDVSPLLYIGCHHEDVQPTDGYISDLMIRPTADTSTTHYDSGLPWTNPENVLNAETGAYLDKFGNLAVRRITASEDDAYSVVEQYTIDDQTVTKWSNGDMEIRGSVVNTSASITLASGYLFRSGSSDIAESYLEDFIEAPFCLINLIDEDEVPTCTIKLWVNYSTRFSSIIYSTTSQSLIRVAATYIAKGKGK